MSKKLKKLGGFLLFSLVVLFVMFLFTVTLTLSKAGLDDPEVFRIMIFYLIVGFGSFIVICVGYVYEYITKEKDSQYGDSLAYYNIGEKPALKYFKRFTAPQLTLLSMIVFGLLFLIANVSRVFVKSLTGLYTLPTQQFSPVDSLLFSTALIPSSENLLMGAVLVVLIISLRILARKKNFSPSEFKILKYTAIPVILGIFGILWHLSVYPGSETALLVVFIFWISMAFLNIMVGFFAVGWVIHANNNFFIDIARFLSSEAVLVWFGMFIFVLIVIYGFYYRKRPFGRKLYNFEK